MKYKIGFQGYGDEERKELHAAQPAENKPVKSVVQVRFPDNGRSLAYYNDKFDLHIGDIVFVDGKLEGVQGIVTEVSRSFRIRLSDYKRVIAVADTAVKGELFFGGSHLIAFDQDVIPYEKIRGWFLPPRTDEEVAVGYDDLGFSLDDLGGLNIRSEIADRGFDYYNRNKVLYICVDGSKGRALVKGTEVYEVSFEFSGGEIRNLNCGCFCSYRCKHEFAVLLQLRETLQKIQESYVDEYLESDYFAAINKGVLLSFTVDGDKSGKIVLG